MLFGDLGAPAKARPEVPEMPGSESSKGHHQSRERSVTRTTCMGESGQLLSPDHLKCLPETGRSGPPGRRSKRNDAAGRRRLDAHLLTAPLLDLREPPHLGAALLEVIALG